jgi:hypothetical protein
LTEALSPQAQVQTLEKLGGSATLSDAFFPDVGNEPDSSWPRKTQKGTKRLASGSLWILVFLVAIDFPTIGKIYVGDCEVSRRSIRESP